MSRSKIIIIAAFLLVLSAGVVVGRLWAAAPMHSAHQPSWLVDQLNLSAQQQQQMDAIWSETRAKLDKARDRRQSLEKDREQAVLKMLNSDQQAAYEKIVADYRAQRAELEKDREKLIHEADDRSRALLNPEQLKKFQDLQSAHNWHGHGPTTQRFSSNNSSTKPSGN